MNLRVCTHGSVVGFTLGDDEARVWWAEHCGEPEPWQIMGNTVYVDHGPARAIIEALIEEDEP